MNKKIIFLVTIAIFISSCSNRNNHNVLLGTWELDKEYTENQIQNNANYSIEDIKWMKNSVTRYQMVFTDKQFNYKYKNINISRNYKIINSVNNQYTLNLSNNNCSNTLNFSIIDNVLVRKSNSDEYFEYYKKEFPIFSKCKSLKENEIIDIANGYALYMGKNLKLFEKPTTIFLEETCEWYVHYKGLPIVNPNDGKQYYMVGNHFSIKIDPNNLDRVFLPGA